MVELHVVFTFNVFTQFNEKKFTESLNNKNRLQETDIYEQHTHIHAAYTYTIMTFRVYTDKNIQFI